MGVLVHRTLAVPLSAIALFTVALSAPSGAALLLMPPATVLVAAALGLTAIAFFASGAIPFRRPSRSLVRVRPREHTANTKQGMVMAGCICVRTVQEPDRSAADDALDLVRMDDDGGWQMPRPPL